MPQLLKIPELKPRERLLAIGAGLVVMVVLMDRLVLAPWVRHVQIVRREIRTMETALRSNQQLLARKDRVTSDLARYQRYLHPPIADDLQTAALLKEVEATASESHVSVGEITPLPVESDEAGTRYGFEVKFECTPEAWVEFLYRIEASPSLFEVARGGVSVKEGAAALEGTVRLVSAAMSSGVGSTAGESGGSHAAAGLP